MSKKNKNTFTCTLMFTEQQHEEIMKYAKAFNSDDLVDFLNRCIALGKILGHVLMNDNDLIAINTDTTSILEQKESKQIAIVGNRNDIKFITQDIKDATEFQEEIKKTNAWGLPIDPIQC